MEIYTIGHSNMPVPEFISLLDRYKIAAVIDVRSVPASKHASQYNKTEIQQELESNGIKYLYLADDEVGNYLGGRPKDASCYRAGVVDHELVRRKTWYRIWINEVSVYAKNHRTALMCAEEDPCKCHRHHLLAQTMLALGMKVYHIRRGGSLEEARKEIRQSLMSSYI